MRFKVVLILICFLLSLSACAKDTGDENMSVTETEEKANEIVNEEQYESDVIAIEQTGYTLAVPSEYLQGANEKGDIEHIEYATKDYAGGGSDITKEAYVYLPYGYDANDAETRYNILYLMHGWTGHAGEYFEYGRVKNILDNMIERGDIEPMIVVSPTFYNEASGTDFESSVSELRAFHYDFENALMQAVEGTYHTYAESTTDEDLKASRDHRAFGGFSLGSVTTWMQFCYDYDYIKYFPTCQAFFYL